MAGKRFRLSNAPLVHVLIQVVVDQYLNVGTRIPDLQEALRPIGFLSVQEVQFPHLNLDLDTGQIRTKHVPLWYFFTKDRTTRICVGSNSVVLQRTMHTHFDEMKAVLLQAIAETDRVWQGGHQLRHRLGLRYVNHVIPKDPATPPVRLLAPGFHGLTKPDGSGPRCHNRMESVLECERGSVAVRYSDVSGQPPLPPGIDPFGMQQQKTPPPGIAFGILDIDRFDGQQRDFDISKLDEDLIRFNQDAEQALLASCTDQALREWGFHHVD